MIDIYNTLTKQKELLQPIEPNKIGIYVCGLTAYDYYHIGNARVFVTFDVIVRYLRARGYEVFYVRNITDIDDKIIHRAEIMGVEPLELAERFIIAMQEDNAALGLLPANLEPRATSNVPEMIAMIAILIEKGYAYIASDGDVYYDITKFKTYGQLAHQDLANLRSGARVEITEAKRDPLDFVLWKKAKPNEPAWKSPWGDGRPGWHIECAVMSTLHVGENFDIHGGGADLKFPHHENEIAQTEAAFGHKTVNIWMHVGFVEINKAKMSKSLGNFYTLREVLKKYHAETVRWFILSSHYRSPLNYSMENLDNAKVALTHCYIALQGLPKISLSAFPSPQGSDNFVKRFYTAMNDDFNTPVALAVIFDIIHEINRLRSDKELQRATKLAAILRKLGEILGILQQESIDFLRHGIVLNEKDIENLVKERDVARKHKNWEIADQIRRQLAQLGIELEDTPSGTMWRKN